MHALMTVSMCGAADGVCAQILAEMPDPNKRLLFETLRLGAVIAAEHEKNKMPALNVSTVLGPNLLRPEARLVFGPRAPIPVLQSPRSHLHASAPAFPPSSSHVQFVFFKLSYRLLARALLASASAPRARHRFARAQTSGLCADVHVGWRVQAHVNDIYQPTHTR